MSSSSSSTTTTTPSESSEPLKLDRAYLQMPLRSATASAGSSRLVYEHYSATAHNQICSSSNERTRSDETCFTGCRVYNGSQVLGAFVLSCEPVQRHLAGKRVIELGCGAGLSGLAAAACGAASVMWTDMEPTCLELARRNTELNSEIFGSKPHQQLTFSRLKWEPEEVAKISGAKFHIVLAAELLYFRVDARKLVATVASLLDPADGVCFFCHANRIASGQEGSREIFPALLDDFGLVNRRICIPRALERSPEAEELLQFSSRIDFIACAHNTAALDAVVPSSIVVLPREEEEEQRNKSQQASENNMMMMMQDGLFE